MAAQISKSRPTFLWHGTLLMLPVLVLAVIGFASLRQDEQAAEADARRKAAQSAQNLAHAMRAIVNDELAQFLYLQDAWVGWARLAKPTVLITNTAEGFTETFVWALDYTTNSGVPQLYAAFATNVLDWEQSHAGLKLEELATADGLIPGDGLQARPQHAPGSPQPPKWFLDLSLRQRTLWQELKSSAQNTGVAREGTVANRTQAAYSAFLDSNPSEEAKEAAFRLLRSPDQTLHDLVTGRGSPLAETDTGLSYQEIACYQVLAQPRASPDIRLDLINALWWQVIERACFLSGSLMDLAAQWAEKTDASTQQQMRWIRRLWESQSRARPWLAALRESPTWPATLAAGHGTAAWARADEGDALAFIAPPAADSIGNGSSLSNGEIRVRFVPQQVVESVFGKALAENRFLVPEYAQAAIIVERVALNSNDSRRQVAGAPGPVLARAAQGFGPDRESSAGHFEVQFYLTDPKQMLATERRRLTLFGGLIGASTIVALLGLGAAYRAFHRQLRLNDLKSDFVSSVSHELRAPVASVRLMAESLEGGRVADEPRKREYFRFIGQECRRLSALIENVLDFSRIERGRKHYEFEPTDLAALTKATVALMQTYAAEREVKLDLRVPSPLTTADSPLAPHPSSLTSERPTHHNFHLLADGKALQQALVNLIDNAIKHSSKGQTVTIGLDTHTQYATRNTQHAPTLLWVEDQGEGIPAAEHERIFERFYRLGSELRRETQGVGIGLSIVKHVVEAHGGRVHVRSAPGQGSRFTIELPMQ